MTRGTGSWYTGVNSEPSISPDWKRRGERRPMKSKPLVIISIFVILLTAGIHAFPHYLLLYTANQDIIGFDYFIFYASVKALDAGIYNTYYSPEMKKFYESLCEGRWEFIRGSGDSRFLPFYLLIEPLSIFPFKTSVIIFIVFSIASLIFCIYLLSLLLIKNRKMAFLIATLMTLYLPFCSYCVDNILLGQVGLLLAASLILCFYFNEKKNPWLSGIFLALAVLLKTYPLMMLFYFLGKRDFKTVISCVASLGTLSVIAGLRWGFYRYAQLQDNLNYLLQTVYYASYTRDPASHFQADSLTGMINAACGFTLSLTQMKEINIIIIIVFAIYIVRLSGSRMLHGEFANVTAYSICLISSMICAPFTWPPHHIIMVIPFIACLAMFLHEGYSKKIGGALYPILFLFTLYFIMDGEVRARVWMIHLHVLYDKFGMGLLMSFFFLIIMLYLLVSMKESGTPAEHKP